MEPNTELKNFENWSVQCSRNSESGEKACALFTQVTLENGQRLLTLQIRDISRDPNNSGPNYVAIVTVPLGVHLPSGIRMQVDDTKALELIYERCDQGGCYAGTAVGETLSAALKAGKDCIISFNNLEGKTLKATLPLKGYTAGFNAL